MTGQIVPRGTRRFGADGASHFFGYYNKSPWDRTGRWLLAHRSPLHGGALTGEEVAEIGMFDTAGDGAFQPLTRTKAWNWQMGAQLQWLGGTERQIIFNVRADSGLDPVFGAPFHARVLDIGCGEARDLPLPVYVVAPDGSAGYCVNYARLAHTHPTIGYFDGAPVAVPSDCPDGDGIFLHGYSHRAVRTRGQLCRTGPAGPARVHAGRGALGLASRGVARWQAAAVPAPLDLAGSRMRPVSCIAC